MPSRTIAFRPTPAAPCSPEKLLVMRERYLARLPLFHPGDAKMESFGLTPEQIRAYRAKRNLRASDERHRAAYNERRRNDPEHKAREAARARRRRRENTLYQARERARSRKRARACSGDTAPSA